MKLSYAFAAVLLLAVGFSSCSETQELHVDLHDPVEGAKFSPGDEIHCDFGIHSNTELLRYTIEIHGMDSAAWNYFEENPVSGKNVDIHKDLYVPAGTVSGEYHFRVWAYDQVGDSAQAEVGFTIEP